ncbi:AraC family transcriptional regulator [Krasilnikovia sp. MM14-A1259]|uniref:AraC family transcriptional regulator n=1 Tax=Krasilnikovia sp. MM14-A1259 TaxID=3373539 RepID=UPI0038291DEC
MRSPEPVMHRSEVHTADRDLAAAAANTVASHRARITFHDPAAVDFRLSSVSGRGFGAHTVRITGMRYAGTCDPLDFLLAGLLTEGHAVIEGAGQEIALDREAGFLYPPGHPFRCDYLDPALLHVQIPLAHAEQVAEETTGLRGADLRFEAMTPVSEPMRRHWADTAPYLGRRLAAPELTPLIAAHLLRFAAATVLAVFPNTALTAARGREPGRIAPAVVRRAVAYMDAHAGQPLTVADVAAAAGVGPRALQDGFRRHLGTTPLSYLRRVRLERAHRDLQAADPAGGVTVAAVARRWGFANLSRFAGAYRSAYGRLPGQSLRT